MPRIDSVDPPFVGRVKDNLFNNTLQNLYQFRETTSEGPSQEGPNRHTTSTKKDMHGETLAAGESF
jgi:hypothetical protein